MSPGASIRRLLVIGLLGLLVSALGGTRPARGSTCHAPERPTFGLQRTEIVALLAGSRAALAAPAYRPMPCSEDPAVIADDPAVPVACAATIIGLDPPAPVAPLVAVPAVGFVSPERGARLDRPPRPA